MHDFAEFVLPDGRQIFIRRAAVDVVYDMAGAGDPKSIVACGTQLMPVPYAAAQVMEILFG